MKTSIENHKCEITEIEIHYSHEFKGRGSWSIICEATFGKGQGYTSGFTKKFNTHTTDSEFIDMITGMRSENASSDEIQEAYHNSFYHNYEESLVEWCDERQESLVEIED